MQTTFRVQYVILAFIVFVAVLLARIDVAFNNAVSDDDTCDSCAQSIETTPQRPTWGDGRPLPDLQPVVVNSSAPLGAVLERDRRVVADPLFPPVSRDDVVRAANMRVAMALADRYVYDTFRPIAYLSDLNNPKDILVLYGRSKDERGHRGEFYIGTTDSTSTFKYMLTDRNSNLKNLDDLPPSVIISGDIMPGTYKLTELPRGDMSTLGY